MGASAAMSYLAEVFLECARLRKKKLLLERVSPCAMPIDELFSTMDYIVSLGTDTRIAFLNSHDSAAENLKPVVDYGADRGGNYGYFEISDDAVRWLMLGID